MTTEEENDIAKIVQQVASHINDKNALMMSLASSLRLFHSMGYRKGYSDAMNDAKDGKDQRVVAHLNWFSRWSGSQR